MPTPRRGQAARIEKIIERHFASVPVHQLAGLRVQLGKSLAVMDRYGGNPCGLTPCPLVRVACACDSRAESVRCPCCMSRPFRPCNCHAGYADCRHIVTMRADLFKSFDNTKWAWAWNNFEMVALMLMGDYDEPPPPPTPDKRVTKEQELDLFIARAGVKRSGGPSQYALRHPQDELEADGVGTQAGKGLVRLKPRLTKN